MGFYPDERTREELVKEITELSTVVQQHENKGETLYAEACHWQMNNAIDSLRNIDGR